MSTYSLENAVIAAGNKKFNDFKTELSKVVDTKLKTRVDDYIKHLEKNIFKPEKD